jgi:glycosyltransferase involved in cell wall biosynthesis
MSLPRISIVTPCYNHAQYIEWTVRSVLLQRYPNLEYIFMDGGSTDGTQDIVAPYRDRFSHYVSERDKGQSDAIHRGFKESTGEIMAYLNSDDMLAPGTLHYVAEFFAKHPNVDVLYSHRCTVDSANKALWYWILPKHNNYLMMRWDLIPQETTFWRRGLYEKVGPIDPQYRFAMDYELFIRFMREGTLHRTNRFLGAFRQHDSAKTSQLLETVGKQEIEQVWRKYGLKNSRLDPIRSKMFFYGAMRHGCQYAQSGKMLPGSLPGIGYDYDDVWGGLLNEKKRLPVMGA